MTAWSAPAVGCYKKTAAEWGRTVTDAATTCFQRVPLGSWYVAAAGLEGGGDDGSDGGAGDDLLPRMLVSATCGAEDVPTVAAVLAGKSGCASGSSGSFREAVNSGLKRRLREQVSRD